MSGHFNLTLWHGVPAVNSWAELLQTQNIVRTLPQDEFDEAVKVINGDDMDQRVNVTIRWHESHYNGCPYAPLDRDAPLDREAPRRHEGKRGATKKFLPNFRGWTG